MDPLCPPHERKNARHFFAHTPRGGYPLVFRFPAATSSCIPENLLFCCPLAHRGLTLEEGKWQSPFAQAALCYSEFWIFLLYDLMQVNRYASRSRLPCVACLMDWNLQVKGSCIDATTVACCSASNGCAFWRS